MSQRQQLISKLKAQQARNGQVANLTGDESWAVIQELLRNQMVILEVLTFLLEGNREEDV